MYPVYDFMIKIIIIIIMRRESKGTATLQQLWALLGIADVAKVEVKAYSIK